MDSATLRLAPLGSTLMLRAVSVTGGSGGAPALGEATGLLQLIAPSTRGRKARDLGLLRLLARRDMRVSLRGRLAIARTSARLPSQHRDLPYPRSDRSLTMV